MTLEELLKSVFDVNDIEEHKHFISELKSNSEDMSYAYRGELNAHYGCKHTEENIKFMSEIRSKNNKGKKWYNNGVVNTFLHECPEGFVVGRINQKATTTGYKWWNNGTEQVLSDVCPEGWKLGMLDKTEEHCKKISNTRKEKCIGGKKVITPDGTFRSMNECCIHYNKSHTYIKRRMKLYPNEWKWG